MSTDPEATPLPGKRQLSSSPQTNAAGLPTSHKRVRVGDYPDPAHTGPSTSAADDVHPIGTSTTLTSLSSEISEDEEPLVAGNPRSVSPQVKLLPHSEAPKERAPFSRRFAPSKNPKTDYRRTSPVSTKTSRHANKPKKLVGTARIKKQNRDRVLEVEQHVNKGERLLRDIIISGVVDPLSEWFHRLRIPCHRERVGRVSRAIPPSDAAKGIPLAKRIAITPTPVDKGIGPLDGVLEENSIEPEGTTSCHPKFLLSKSNASVSDLTQDQLHKHLAWEFPNYKPPKEPPRTNNLAALYDGEPAKKAMEDITCLVKATPREEEKKPLVLDRRIKCHLREEEHHFSLGWKLRLPEIWKEIRDQPRPWSYTIPERYAPFVYNKVANVPIRNEQSYSGASLSSGSTDSDGNVVQWPPPPQTPVMPTPTLQSNEEILPDDPLGMEILQHNYKFDDSDTLVRKLEIANALNEEIKTITGPHERHKYIVALYNRIGYATSIPVEHLKESEIQDQDAIYGYGDTTTNSKTNDHLQFEPFIIEKFIAFPGVSEESPSEGRVEAIVGSLLQGIMAGPGLMDREQMSAPFPGHLCPVGTKPSPDKYARADKGSLGWPEKLLPVLFGAECKPVKTYSVWHTRAQLAAAFHGTLITLILYYLDTRHSVSSALPAWLFLYGIEYTEKGVVIHAHHPAYFIDEKDPVKNNHWILKATIISTAYSTAFLSTNPTILRLKLLAAFFRIRSHALHVLDLLKKWQRGPDVLRILSLPEVIKWGESIRHVQEDSNNSMVPPPIE